MHVNQAAAAPLSSLLTLRGAQPPPRPAAAAPPAAAKTDADGDHDGGTGKNVDVKA